MKNLGVAVTAVHEAILADANYKRNLYVDLACARAMDAVAQGYGFRSVHHLRDELARRTTDRVAYGYIPPILVE